MAVTLPVAVLAAAAAHVDDSTPVITYGTGPTAVISGVRLRFVGWCAYCRTVADAHADDAAIETGIRRTPSGLRWFERIVPAIGALTPPASCSGCGRVPFPMTANNFRGNGVPTVNAYTLRSTAYEHIRAHFRAEVAEADVAMRHACEAPPGDVAGPAPARTMTAAAFARHVARLDPDTLDPHALVALAKAVSPGRKPGAARVS